MRGKGWKNRWEVKKGKRDGRLRREREMRVKGGKKRWEVKEGKRDER